ncbi:MAG TPA: carbohydrate porin, partial [Gemmataceae bacterium]
MATINKPLPRRVCALICHALRAALPCLAFTSGQSERSFSHFFCPPTTLVLAAMPRRRLPPFVRLYLLAVALATPLSTCPALAQADKLAVEGVSSKVDDMKAENGKDKEPDKKDKANGNGDRKKDEDDKDKEEDKCKLLPEGWNFHAQTTVIANLQPGFGALYSGPNSLGPGKDRRGTISADLYFGVPLWHGAEFHADLLMWQGFGLSDSFGLEAFPNADAYKAGTADPRFMFSHFFVRQTFGLGGEQEDVPDGPFTLPGKRDVSRLTVTAGRMNMTDIFDINTYNHDPHAQFMSWASSMLTWDYPADTIGYTTGIALDLNQPD